MKYLLALILLTATSIGYAGVPEVGSDDANVIVIDREISGQTMAPLNAWLTQAISTDTSPKGSKLVDLVINSPGGSVTTGFEFVSLMRTLQGKGWKFRCYVYHVAASMAFQTYLQCDRRFALTNSFLLWHRARVFLGGLFGVVMTAPQAALLSESLEAVDEQIYDDLTDHLGAKDEYIRHHFEAETLHIGSQLHAALPSFLTVYDYIPGMIEALADPKVVRTPASRGFFDGLRGGDLIYIWNRWSGASPVTTTNH